MQTKKGFTLVELLIVIGILAILSTAAVLVINPAQLLAQSRDAKRAADIEALNAALAFFMVDGNNVSATTLDGGNADNCTPTASAGGEGFTAVNPANTSFTNVDVSVVNAGQSNNGSGWLPVNFTDMQSGAAPISSLPVDPTHPGTTHVYRYACSGTYYELNTSFESAKYQARYTTDGGDSGAGLNFYEVGSALNL